MLFFGHIGITAGATGLVRRNRIDYRAIIIGSILPDIIDKPLFLLLGKEVVISGRAYAHTLLFCLALGIAGILARRKGRAVLLLLSVGSLAHLALDSIWRIPVTALWPFLGPIQPGDVDSWLPGVLGGILTPGVLIPEIIGLGILGYLFVRVRRGRGFAVFMKTGEIS